jgi:hypothetical protein
MNSPLPIIKGVPILNTPGLKKNTIYSICFGKDKYGDTQRYWNEVTDTIGACPVGYTGNKPGAAQFAMAFDPSSHKSMFTSREYGSLKDAQKDFVTLNSGGILSGGGKRKTKKIYKMMGKGSRKMKRRRYNKR